MRRLIRTLAPEARGGGGFVVAPLSGFQPAAAEQPIEMLAGLPCACRLSLRLPIWQGGGPANIVYNR